jgi:hypothetical protein
MAELIRFAPNRALDLNGDPAPGARAYFYAYGTTDLAPVYADIDMTVEHPSPLVADGRGVFPLVYAAQPLAVTVTDDEDVALDGYPMELAASIPAGASAAAGITFNPTAEIPVTDVQAAIERVQENIIEPLADFGLGVTGDATLIANIDATDTASGAYRFSNTTTGTFPTGYTVTSGAVVIWRQSSAIAWQWLYTGGLTYLRRLNTTWEAWREVVTVPQGSARGDIIYRGATVWARLAKGSADQILRMGANDPTWGADAPGDGQQWQTVSRTDGTTYTNSTGRSIMVAITLTLTSTAQASHNGSTWVTVGDAAGSESDRRNTVTFIVPPGHRYRCVGSFSLWRELR